MFCEQEFFIPLSFYSNLRNLLLFCSIPGFSERIPFPSVIFRLSSCLVSFELKGHVLLKYFKLCDEELIQNLLIRLHCFIDLTRNLLSSELFIESYGLEANEKFLPKIVKDANPISSKSAFHKIVPHHASKFIIRSFLMVPEL